MSKYIYAVKEIYGGKKPLAIARAEIRRETPKCIMTSGDTDAAFGGRLMYHPDHVHRTAEAAVWAYMERKDQEIEGLHGAIGEAERQADAAMKLLSAARKLDREAFIPARE